MRGSLSLPCPWVGTLPRLFERANSLRSLVKRVDFKGGGKLQALSGVFSMICSPGFFVGVYHRPAQSADRERQTLGLSPVQSEVVSAILGTIKAKTSKQIAYCPGGQIGQHMYPLEMGTKHVPKMPQKAL